MSERIFNVSRSTKTGKTVNVGDFPTVEQAQAAMLSHYKVTPKRGDFRYRIFEEELEEINGVTFRKFCLVLSGGNKPFRQFNRPWEYDYCDIAEKLVELSNLPDDGQLKNELTDALYYLKAVAENPYSKSYTPAELKALAESEA